jgi:3-hydroxyisobutyrate dehydrogenase-like beta-hydroxyacid dehydrogenase
MVEAETAGAAAGRRAGFIGLGKMGGAMATHLLRAGARLTVYDIRPEAVAPLVALGARAAGSPREVGHASEVVFLMLHAPAVEPAVVGADGLLAGLAAGGIIVDGGNSDPAVSQRLAARCAERGVQFLDAGVSGGPGGAAAGRLAVMVGGDAGAYARCRPLLRAFGGAVEYLGPSGSGHLAKLINNAIVAMTTAVVGEALALAEASQLDLAALTRVIATGAARCWPLEKMAQYYNEPLPPGWQEPRGGGHAPGQLTWALRLAAEAGLALPLTGLTHELYKLTGLELPPAGLAMLRRAAAAGQQFPDRPAGGPDA